MSDDRYRLLAAIGQGGFGRVDRVFDEALGRVVAKKSILRPTPWHRGQLDHEARLLAWLAHPGVPAVHDTVGGAVVMELLDGETLEAHLADRRERLRPMPPSEAVRVLRRIAETLASAHDKGVLHLDLKPANVMLRPYGQVVVVDWGAARFFDPGPYRAHLAACGVTAVGDLGPGRGGAGTPAYMAPERVLADPGLLRPPADVYAAGVLLYEMLAGDLPGPDAAPLHRRRGDVSPALSALCQRMRARHPGDRPPDFHAVLAELSGAATTRPERDLAPGDVLFQRGDRSDEAWLIVAGRLEVVAEGRVLGTRGPGEVVGEVGVITGERRSALLRAVTEARVRAVTRADIEASLDAASPLLAGMARQLSQRLRESVGAAEPPDTLTARLDAGLPTPSGDVLAPGVAMGPPAERLAAAPRVRAALVARGMPEAVAVDAALTRLAAVDPVQARLAEGRIFGDLELDELAVALDLDPEAARREWAMARAIMRRALQSSAARPSPP